MMYFEISMIAFQSKKLCQRIISIWCRHQEQHSFEMIIASSNLFGIKNNIPYHLQICLQGPGFVQICVACRNTKQLKRFETKDKEVSVRPLQCVWPLHWSTSQIYRGEPVLVNQVQLDQGRSLYRTGFGKLG